MVQFTRMRLSGFKSFVDSTEFEIAPGMTGIVGPNGCGKSNLLEALRWCMGEGSAKQLRGSGMEDVIFSGTSDRPARNIAEVTLSLENDDRRAPAIFNDHEELQIVRRIERDHGSAYKVNGKDVRARDVQLLFADLSTGARSTAIVSQGRIGHIVNAKPTERRLLLEEAAGITGLHSRRHEAELRLRAAENNLARLEDVVAALESQLQALKRQARQASRYNNLSDHIRRAEAIQLHLRWTAAVQELENARNALREIESRVAEMTSETNRASTVLAEEGAALPALRQREAEVAAELQRYLVERDGIDAEEARLTQQREELTTRKAQIGQDLQRESGFIADAEAAIARLAEETASLEAAQASDSERRAEAEANMTAAREAASEQDSLVTELTRKVASDEARRADLARQVRELEQRVDGAARRLSQAEADRDALQGEETAAELDAAETAVRDTQRALDSAQAAQEEAESRREQLDASVLAARQTLQAREDELGRQQAEARGLAEIVENEDAGDYPPVLERIKAVPGYEAALGVALGEDLGASTDRAAAVHWSHADGAGDAPSLPAGCQPLSEFVTAPKELYRRLEQIGVVEDEAAAAPLVAVLKTGQRLVTKAGALWRWDGFVVKAGAPTSAAVRLRQENRLREIRATVAEAEATVAVARSQYEEAKTRADEAGQSARSLAETAKAAFRDLNAARDRQTRAAQAAAAHDSKLAALVETIERLAGDRAEAEERLQLVRKTQAALPPVEADREKLAAARTELEVRRRALSDAESLHNGLEAEARGRGQRLIAIGDEKRSWESRLAGARQQVGHLTEREQATDAALEELAGKPAVLDEKRQALLTSITDAEERRKAAADTLAEAETRVSEIDSSLKIVERGLADAREQRGRSQGAVQQAEQTVEAVRARIAERLRCAPETVLELAELREGEALPPLDTVTAKLEKLIRERENMGPVNLRADQEARELEEQITTYESERDDLLAAIDKFRRAINELNREGRERLMASFEKVNTAFEDLFTRLFGGGRAHLALTEADDPLQAGLEIMASPPGKRLQSLGLLSGGEKALTALALLFAVFLTNPAPICVLDEVDAPLDDSNVDRFCTLVEDIAKETQTRFLIVTHHRMTMARMDRLYGVTMAERGVSQLVSVDLQEAEAIRATA